MTHQPEKLNLWDRLFNRYKTEVAERGVEPWKWYIGGSWTQGERNWVEYRIIDRLTGSETINREYLN